ncbi:MAG: DUF63 family protein [Candidatus Aenigmatarchaeota archaeon]
MNIESFFHQYFVQPILQKEGYNVVNTFAYAILFIILSYLTFNFLKTLKIKIDYFLAFSISPYIISGVIVRVLNDAGIIKGYIFVTPNIWLLFFTIILLAIIASSLAERKFKIPYYKTMFLFGFIILSFLLGMVKINNFLALWYFLAFFIPAAVLISLVKFSIENKIVLSLQALDSIVTAIAITWFGYTEQHVLPRILIEKTNTAFSFVIVKIAVIYFALKLLDDYEKDKEFNFYIKLLIAVLGLSTGLRSLLRLLYGV